MVATVVVVHPPVVLVRRVLPVHHAAWVIAVVAAIASGVADHDIPHRVRGVAVQAHVVGIHDADVGFGSMLLERDEP